MADSDSEYEPDTDDDDPDERIDSDEEETSGLFVLDGDDDDSDDADDIQEVTLDPAQFMELFMLHATDREQARAVLHRLVNAGRMRRSTDSERRKRRWFKPQVEPHPKGVALLRSGDFGPAGPWKSKRLRPGERYGWRASRDRALRRPLAEPAIPNSHGTVVAEYSSVPYVGQFCGPDHGVFCASRTGAF
jgi:WD repeat-containing protein 23